MSGGSDPEYGGEMPDADLTAAAVKTYLYGYPLVYNLVETQRLLDGTSALLPGAQANRFSAARELLGPDATFVSRYRQSFST